MVIPTDMMVSTLVLMALRDRSTTMPFLTCSTRQTTSKQLNNLGQNQRCGPFQATISQPTRLFGIVNGPIQSASIPRTHGRLGRAHRGILGE